MADGFESDFEPCSFDTLKDAKQWLSAFSLARGFAVTTRKSWLLDNKPKASMQCALGGTLRNYWKITPEKRQRWRHSGRKDCPFRADLRWVDGKWHVFPISPQHNHVPLESHEEHHHSHRKLTAEDLEGLRGHLWYTTNNHAILANIKANNPACLATPKDIQNAKQKVRLEEFRGNPTIQGAFEWLSQRDGQWKYKADQGEHERLDKILFLNAEMIDAVHRWGSVLQMDCTYSTNRYKMPLLEIVGITASGHTFIAAYGLLLHENTEFFRWALRAFLELTAASEPLVVVTDRDLALIKALDAEWPASFKMLCRWHIDKDIAAQVRSKLARNENLQADDAEEMDTSFMKAWRKVFWAVTREDFDSKWLDCQLAFGVEPASAPLIEYIEETWMPWVDRFALHSVNKHQHFRSYTTGRAESAHHALKSRVVNRRADLFSLLGKIATHADNLQSTYRRQISRDTRTVPSALLLLQFFTNVVRKISVYALRKVFDTSYRSRNDPEIEPVQTCTCSVCTTNGWPCAAVIKYLVENTMLLTVDHFAPQWQLSNAAGIVAGTRSYTETLANDTENNPVEDLAMLRLESEDPSADLPMTIDPPDTRLELSPAPTADTALESLPSQMLPPLSSQVSTTSARRARSGRILNRFDSEIESLVEEGLSSTNSRGRRAPACSRCRRPGHNILRCPERHPTRGPAQPSQATQLTQPQQVGSSSTEVVAADVQLQLMARIVETLDRQDQREQQRQEAAQLYRIEQQQIVYTSYGQSFAPTGYGSQSLQPSLAYAGPSNHCFQQYPPQ